YFCTIRRLHTRFSRDWSSDVCSSDLKAQRIVLRGYPMLALRLLDDPPKGIPFKFGGDMSVGRFQQIAVDTVGVILKGTIAVKYFYGTAHRMVGKERVAITGLVDSRNTASGITHVASYQSIKA